jgi:hypothetical protein
MMTATERLTAIVDVAECIESPAARQQFLEQAAQRGRRGVSLTESNRRAQLTENRDAQILKHLEKLNNRLPSPEEFAREVTRG